MPSAALLGLVRRWEDRGLEPHSVTVLRHGRTLAEGWWAPYHRDGLQLMYSVSKTFTACAAGFAVAEGLLALEERVVDLFPEHAAEAGPRARVLTLHDLLAMRTGHRVDTLTWRDHRAGPFPQVFLGAEPEEERGWFVYHNGATSMAALAVQRRSGQRLVDYLRPRLLEPLGIEGAAWSSHDGADLGYSGLHVNTSALARLGELVLRDGSWQGQQVLPEGWAATMTARHTDTSHHPEKVEWQQGYGYQMWRCRYGAVRADGAYGQFAVVVPDADLVVALTSCTERTQETLDAIWEELLPRLADRPLPADPGAHAALTGHLTSAAVAAPRGTVTPPGPGPWTFVHSPREDVPALERVEVTPVERGTGWRLALTEGDTTLEVPCGEGEWPAPADSGPWTASGGWTAPGVFEARVAAVETPHVLHLRCTDGVATGTWNGLPLNRPVLRRLRAPA
ncbi:serine hydrolase [Nostocoides sp. Soil756]|uniref:serine hydrolase domain-containing protein n=1 Tax=Nostocoides sp. Soil756 TaxID=1736399 RepID=UPI0007007868|nr:serine hydrolase [Tetrasphaera sp. Soil756]KRE63035.1 hypothetical protein ASG78_08845 [Tetrasphaera sp. Soil756]